jgi:hypothetical protein
LGLFLKNSHDLELVFFLLVGGRLALRRAGKFFKLNLGTAVDVAQVWWTNLYFLRTSFEDFEFVVRKILFCCLLKFVNILFSKMLLLIFLHYVNIYLPALIHGVKVV